MYLVKRNVKTDITDINLWKGIKDERFLQKWGNCESNEEGDLHKWSSSPLKLINVVVINNTEKMKCNHEKKLLLLRTSWILKKQRIFVRRLEGKWQ